MKRTKTGRFIAGLMSFLMVVLTVFAVDVTPVRAEGEKYSVNFGGGSWNVGGVTVTANKNGTIDIGESEEIELTGFDAATMEVAISASDGFRQELSVTSEGKTSLANRGDGGLPAGTLTFVVQSKPGGSEKHMVNFGGGSWNVGGVTVTANKNGTIEIGESDEIVLSGFDAGTMEVKISATDGFSQVLNVTSDGKTSLANRGGGGLPSGTLDFAITLKGGGSQDPQGPAKGVITLNCQDLEEAAQVMFRFGTDESKEFFTVDNRLVSIPEGESSVTIKFILNDPKVYMLDTGRGVSLRVNGDEKYHLSGQSAEGVMEYTFNLAELAGDKAINQSSFELSYGFQYSDPSMDKRPQNMLWVYSEEYGQAHHFVDPQGDVDCLVLNGDVDIIAIEYDGTTYSKDELLELGSKEDGQRGDVWYEVDPGNMGYAQIPSGALVTVKLLPDYGYQVLRAELNGSEIAPTEEQSVFTFTMPTNPLHLSAVFEECKDEVVSSAGDIKSGAIQLGANEINAGSALLTVGDSIDEAVFNGTMHELAGYEIASCLEIGLQQVFYKGTKEDYWSNNKDTLTNKATVSLSLADEVGTDVKILHEKHDGTIEILDATVENGVVTFETSSFSTYAIVKVGTSKNETTEAPSTSQSQKNKEENIIDNTPISTSHAGSSSILESGMLIKDINATAVGNTLTIDRSYNRQFLTNAEMKALLKKGTVALRMQYKYNGIEYDITIPAGAAIDDSIPFYGPLYLASHFPATKVTSKGNATKATSGKATKGVVTGSYVINSGDSLYKIARKYGTTVSDLKDKNPQIKNISLIHPGQTINI